MFHYWHETSHQQRIGLVNHMRWMLLRHKVFSRVTFHAFDSASNMAYLQCLLVFYWTVYVSTSSQDMDYCCSICVCSPNTLPYSTVDCSNKSLNKVPDCSWKNVTHIDLSENNITEISKETFQKFKDADILNLSYNKLRFLPDPNITMEKLTKINLNGNNFTVVPMTVRTRMPNLRSLYMMKNRIQEIDDVLEYKKLHTLEFNKNRLKSFPQLVMPKLKKLLLQENRIQEIPKNALKNIEKINTLSLSQNDLLFVHPEFLGSSTKSLQNLELSFNPKLSTIPFDSIKKLTNLEELAILSTNVTAIPDYAFKGLNKLKTLKISRQDNTKDTDIGEKAFVYLPNLIKLSLEDFKLKHAPNLTGTGNLRKLVLAKNELKTLPPDICEILPDLEDLHVGYNKLTSLPSLSSCKNLHDLEIYQNQLTALPSLSNCANLALLKMSHNLVQSFGSSVNGLASLLDISASNNKIESIEESDFKGLEGLETLILNDNKISYIHKNAFSDFKNLQRLMLGHNNFPELPTLGLQTLKKLSIEENSKLIKFPSPRHLPSIESLHLYYPYHCCAFLNKKPDPPNDNSNVSEHPEGTIISWTWLSNSHPDDPYCNEEEGSSDPWPQIQETPSHPPLIKCLPKPDPFFPCEDLMGDWLLRCGVWIVFVLALCGNATVIIVILTSHTKIDVSRFLISNLAFADLFMGIYLGFLAVVDISTLGNFKSYGVEWQKSHGCRTAGFLAVLSSELSVFTLTVITLERYIAIKNAIRVNRKLQLKTAIIVMILGWVFALVTATLPLVEVNSYGKFSVCLPFEIDDKKSMVFLVFLLCLNALAFIVILFCYILMYCSIRGSNAWNASDFRVAKRMALLVFTDFACWAPIVFLSLTAAFGSTIISLSHAKIFTVFVFPLNSCANPFLYAIFTSNFKKDLLAICRRVEDKYPFLKITKQRISFSRRSSYSGAVSENPNLYLRAVRRFSLPVFVRGLTNSITTNGVGCDSTHSNKNSSDTHAAEHECNEHLLQERETSL